MYVLDDIRVAHGGREVLAIGRLSLGDTGLTAVLGHNGSGKSTLMGLLARQSQPDSGGIHFAGQPLSALRQRKLAQRIAYLPQRLPPVPGLTVRELVRLGRFAWRGALGRWRPQDETAVTEALRETHCCGLADQMADEISGGERQRAWIAMLLAQDAEVLLLDEPTAALDLSHAHETMALLSRLAADTDRRIIVVLHDINLATRFADRILALSGGKVAFDGAPEALLRTELLSRLTGIDMTLLPRAPGARPYAVVA